MIRLGLNLEANSRPRPLREASLPLVRTSVRPVGLARGVAPSTPGESNA